MKTTTIIGALVGGAVIIAGSVGYAASKGSQDPPPPFFLYVVQEGDTLSDLALRFFGDAARWPAIAQMNSAALDKLPIGAKIQIPCSWAVVQKGENLATIAKRMLGDGKRWRRIYEANKRVLPDPDKVGVGQRLAVPMADQSSPSTQAVPPTVAAGTGLHYLGAEAW